MTNTYFSRKSKNNEKYIYLLLPTTIRVYISKLKFTSMGNMKLYGFSAFLNYVKEIESFIKSRQLVISFKAHLNSPCQVLFAYDPGNEITDVIVFHLTFQKLYLHQTLKNRLF